MQTPNARVRRDEQGRRSCRRRSSSRATSSSSRRATRSPPTRACCRLSNLAAEEAALTGEIACPSAKDANAPVADDAPHRRSREHASSSGRASCAEARARSSSRRDRDTELGKLATLIHSARDQKTPLEEKLDSFGKQILWACLALSALLFARGYVQGRRSVARAAPRGGEPRGRRDPRGPARDHDDHARARHAAHGEARRDRPQARRGRDARRGDGHLLRQDRHAHAERDDRARGLRGATSRTTSPATGYDPDGRDLDTERASVVDGARASRCSELLATVALCNNATLEQKRRRAGASSAIRPRARSSRSPRRAASRASRSRRTRSLKELPVRQRSQADDGRHARRERAARSSHAKGSADVLLPLCVDVSRRTKARSALDDATRDAILAEAERMSNAGAARARASRGATSAAHSSHRGTTHDDATERRDRGAAHVPRPRRDDRSAARGREGGRRARAPRRTSAR